jgi:hypothetical protein
MKFRLIFSACLPAIFAATALAVPAPLTTYSLPAVSSVGFSTSATFGSDGKLYAYDGLNVFRENAVNGSDFTKISTSDAPVDGSDAGPIRFTADGSTIVVGTGAGGMDFSGNSNGKFLTLPAGGGAFTALGGTVSNQFSFVALPATSSVSGASNKLAVNSASADFSTSSVSYYDRTSLAGSSATPVITNIPGASTDVAFDNAGHFYVGVGFGASAGQVRRFNLSDLDNAFTTSTPLDFTTSGTVLNNTSNNTGSGFFLDDGFLFVGNGSDGFITISPTGDVTSYDVGATNAAIAFNAADDQFAVLDPNFVSGITTANIFNVSDFVPEPATMSVIFLAISLGALRRQRA